MHSTTLLPLTLLSLPLLSAAIPQASPAQPNPTPSQQQQPSTSLTPSQRNEKFVADYNALISAASTIPAYNALATGLTAGAVPASVANAQEQSYINLIKSATGPVPEPAYITGLPQDQQAWVRGFHQQLVSAAAVDLGVQNSVAAAPAATATSNTPSNTTDGVVPTPVAGQNGTQTVANGTTSDVQPPPSSTVGADVPVATSEQPPANGTNGTSTPSGAEKLGGQRGSLWGMAGAGILGVMGSMVLL